MSVHSAQSAHDFFKEKEAENLKKQNERNVDIQLKTETINELRKQNNMLNEEKKNYQQHFENPRRQTNRC